MINRENILLFYRASKTLAVLCMAAGRAIPLALRAWLIFTGWGMWLFAMHSAYTLWRVRIAAAG
jgi:hypothetical protein